MWGSVAVVWTVCLACIQPAVFPWILPFRSNKDRPHPARGALTEKVECFSDYMTLQISRSHVLGLRQWLAGVLRLRGTKRSPKHLDSLLPKCGYLLHPAHEGGYIFRALYSGCFVQKEKADYRLEIRMFGRGAERLKESNRFVMKCPMIVARLGEQSVSCHPSFIQTPWLLSLRGELVASLEDASLIGLEVDIGATMVTIRSPRQEFLQRLEPCQEVRESPGTQAFYRVDLSLDFAEMDSPVHWTVENFFQCAGSREESLVLTTTPTALPALSPGWGTTPVETPSATSSQLQTPPMAAPEELPQHFVHQPTKESTKQELTVPFMQLTRPAGGSRVLMTFPSSSAGQERQGPQTPPEKADLSPHPQTPATLSSEHTEVSQTGPGPSHLVSLTPNSPSTHLSSGIPSSPWPSWPSDGPQMLPCSEPSVTLTEDPRAMRAERDSVQPSGSPFPPGGLSSETANSTESMELIPREPDHVSEEFLPLTRLFMSSLAKEGLIFHHDPERPQERPIIKAEEPLQNDHDPSGEETRGYLDLPTSEPSQEMKGLATDATFTASGRRQPDARAYLETSSPEPTGRHRVGPAALQTALPKGLLASASEKPAAPSEGGADRTLQLESVPLRSEGWHDLGAAHTANPLPSPTQNL